MHNAKRADSFAPELSHTNKETPMRSRCIASVTIAICLALSASSVLAAEGAAKEKMIQALTQAAEGNCDEGIMSPLLLDACEQQSSANQQMLEPLGKITEAKYVGVQEMPGGVKAEAYRVRFEKGSMMWVASLDGAGKLLVLWSNGAVKGN
jgi:hypothetical protein